MAAKSSSVSRTKSNGATEKQSRLGTQLRGKLSEAYGSRGSHLSGLWYGYSHKAKADVVLRSDLEFLHLLYVESDPDVLSVDYEPDHVVARLCGEDFLSVVDATLVHRLHGKVWREVKYAADVEAQAPTRTSLQLMIQLKAAAVADVKHELITEEQVQANPHRLHNWVRILGWLADCRYHALYQYSDSVLKIVGTRRQVTLADVAALGPDSESGLYCAAMFEAVQQGLVKSDLDVQPLRWQTRFFLTGEA